jgi:ferritin-like metal-binding protein YciE
METAHELFVHELTDMLDAETQLVEALGKQSEQASNPELKKGIAAHQKQTQKQAQRIQQIFQELGEGPEQSECKGVRGLIEEYETFSKEEEPSEDLLDMFTAGAAVKVERYEISAYESLIRMAQMMKHRKAVQLLRETLKEEQQMEKRAAAMSKKLKPQNLGMGEEELGGVRAQSSSGRRSGSRRSRKAA